MRTASRLLSASLLVLGVALGGCSANDVTSDLQDDSALFGPSTADEKQAPLRATSIDGWSALTASRDYVFVTKTAGAGGGHESSTVARIKHGETTAETLASFPGRIAEATVAGDALFVTVFADSWQLLRVVNGAAPSPVDAPQFLGALAHRGSELIVSGSKRDRGPDGGVLSIPLSGGAPRTLLTQAEIDRVGGVGKHRVSGASVTSIELAGDDLVLGIQKTVNGSSQSGIVIGKLPNGGASLEVLYDSDDADILEGAGVVGSDVWITRSISHGDYASGELVRIGLASGSTKRVKAPAGAAVSTGDAFFFGEDGYVSSIAEPSTILVHARVGFPGRLVASPEGKRVYVSGNNFTTRLDR